MSSAETSKNIFVYENGFHPTAENISSQMLENSCQMLGTVSYNENGFDMLLFQAILMAITDDMLLFQIILMAITAAYVLMLNHRFSKRSANMKVLEKNLSKERNILRNDRLNHEKIVQFFNLRLEAFEKDKSLFAADKELLSAYINDNKLMNEFDTKIKTLSTELSALSVSFISSYIESKSLLRTRTIDSLEARLKEYEQEAFKRVKYISEKVEFSTREEEFDQEAFKRVKYLSEKEESKYETEVEETETEESTDVEETEADETEAEESIDVDNDCDKDIEGEDDDNWTPCEDFDIEKLGSRRSSRIQDKKLKFENDLIKRMIKVSSRGGSSFFETKSSKKLEKIMKDNGIGYKYRSKPLSGYSVFSMVI